MMLFHGDALTILRSQFAAESVQCCITSPPYWGLRDYGVEGQLGLEATPELYVATMVEVFAEVRRVLKPDGTLWLNLGDSYGTAGNRNGLDGSTMTGSKSYGRGADAEKPCRMQNTGLKHKDLVGIPWRVAFALQADGWYLRSDIIWSKPNPMPESVTDRPTKAHEYLFLLSKSERYYYDAEAIQEPLSESSTSRYNYEFMNGSKESSGAGRPNGASNTAGMKDMPDGRNKRTVWTIATQPYPDAHFATFPTKLVEPCVLAGCPVGGLVLDPFAGSGTVLAVAKQLGRQAVGIELNPAYIALAEARLTQEVLPL